MATIVGLAGNHRQVAARHAAQASRRWIRGFVLGWCCLVSNHVIGVAKSAEAPAPMPAAGESADVGTVQERLGIPAQADQDDRLAVIREIFKEQADAAQSPEEKSELAQSLLNAARDTEDDAVARFVLLRVARDFAIRATDVAVFQEVVDEVAAHYQVDRDPLVVKGLTDCLKYAKKPEQVKALAEEVGKLTELAVQQDRYPHAMSLGDVAGRIARKTRDKRFIKNVTLRNNQIRELADAYADVEGAVATLAKNPDHAAANLAAGRFYCFQKGDWERGLPLLARSGDEDLAEAANGDMKKSRTSAETVKVADQWYTVAQEAKRNGVDHAARRAVELYEAVLDDLTGLAKRRVETKLDELFATTQSGREGPRPPNVPPGAVLIMTFDEDSLVKRRGQTIVLDLSGTNTHGIARGTALTEGVYGEALAFDGSSSHVELGNPPTLQLTGSQTITMWLWVDRLADRRTPFAKASGGEGGIVVERDGRLVFAHGVAGQHGKPQEWIYANAKISPRQWTHVAIVRSSETRSLAWYINGVRTNIKRNIKYPVVKPSPLSGFIGKGHQAPFMGKIDDLMIFSRALAPAEIAALIRRR